MRACRIGKPIKADSAESARIYCKSRPALFSFIAVMLVFINVRKSTVSRVSMSPSCSASAHGGTVTTILNKVERKPMDQEDLCISS